MLSFVLMWNYPLWLWLAYLRNSGARTIICWKSSSDRRPSLSRSASSITFSHTILTSSSVSSLRVSLFSVFSRSDLQMKSSLLKSWKKMIQWIIYVIFFFLHQWSAKLDKTRYLNFGDQLFSLILNNQQIKHYHHYIILVSAKEIFFIYSELLWMDAYLFLLNWYLLQYYNIVFKLDFCQLKLH